MVLKNSRRSFYARDKEFRILSAGCEQASHLTLDGLPLPPVPIDVYDITIEISKRGPLPFNRSLPRNTPPINLYLLGRHNALVGRVSIFRSSIAKCSLRRHHRDMRTYMLIQRQRNSQRAKPANDGACLGEARSVIFTG